MTEKYPFFREEDETTQAVIGEEAAASDLEGTYQKPYAVLTQKHLYCKNKSGNFITEAADLRSAQKKRLPGQNWFLWGVVGCLAVVLLLTCWDFFGDEWRRKSIDNEAQLIIDYYQATEAKMPEYEQSLKNYEDLEEEIEQLQQELEDMDPDRIRQEANQFHQKEAQLQTALDETVEERNIQQSYVNSIENVIAEYNEYIADAEETIENTDVEENNNIWPQIESLQNKISYYEEMQSHYSFTYFADRFGLQTTLEGARYVEIENRRLFDIVEIMSFLNQKIQGIERDISQLQSEYVDLDALRVEIEWTRQYLAESEETLSEYQSDLEKAEEEVNTAQTELEQCRTEVTAADAKVTEVEALEANIAEKQSARDSIPFSDIQNSIQRFKDSKSSLKNAQKIQRRVNVYIPLVLGLMAVLFVATLVCTLLKRAKLAIYAAWATGLMGLALVWLSDINLGNAQGYGWGYYYVLIPPITICLTITAALVLLLGLPALWLERKKNVFQITHSTGAFCFTPSLYPAAEFETFTTQVERLRSEDTSYV